MRGALVIGLLTGMIAALAQPTLVLGAATRPCGATSNEYVQAPVRATPNVTCAGARRLILRFLVGDKPRCVFDNGIRPCTLERFHCTGTDRGLTLAVRCVRGDRVATSRWVGSFTV